jgi:hypothetical protein
MPTDLVSPFRNPASRLRGNAVIFGEKAGYSRFSRLSRLAD